MGLTLLGGLFWIGLEWCWQGSGGAMGTLPWSLPLAGMVKLELVSPNENGFAAGWVTLCHPKNLMSSRRNFLCTQSSVSSGSHLNFRHLSSSKLCPVVATDDTATCALLLRLVQPVFTLPNTWFVVFGVYPLLFSFTKAHSHLKHTEQMDFRHLAFSMLECSQAKLLLYRSAKVIHHQYCT